MSRHMTVALHCYSLFMAVLVCGCTTSLHNAVPVQRLPPILLPPPRNATQPIDFTLLRQVPAKNHVIAPGDILGVHIPEVLTTGRQPPAVYFPQYESNENLELPIIGSPITVEADGTIVLPLVPPIPVSGLTLSEARKKVYDAYAVDRKILPAERAIVMVTLIKPRSYQVLVLREDTPSEAPALINKASNVLAKRGSGLVVELPVGENDVLHALIASGGLPGTDAKNEVWILRSASAGHENWQPINAGLDAGTPLGSILAECHGQPHMTLIPLRMMPGEPAPFACEEVILRDGDVIFIESRETEYFYTGGLLTAGQMPLPRDYDLDIFGAVAMGNGNVAGPAGGTAAIASSFRSGPGNIIPPTRVLVVRTLPNGKQLKIHVDLKRAMDDPRERLIIQPGDMVILAYTPTELAGNIALNFVSFSYAIPNN